MFNKRLATSSIIVAMALAGTPGAWAQQAAAPVDPAQPGTMQVPASEPAINPTPGTATAEPVTEPTQPAPAQQAQAGPAQPAANPQVAAFVDQQFTSLDADHDGNLTQAEFEGWISRLKTAELQAAGKPVSPAEVKTYAENAFLSADKDADKKVSKGEVTQFLSQG